MVYNRLPLINRSIRISLAVIGIACLLLVLPSLRASNSANRSRSTGARVPESQPLAKAAAADGRLEALDWFGPFGLPPVGPTVTATKSHAGGPFHLGDTITYSTTISDSGTGATGVDFTDTPDANTTFVAGSLMVSPVALDDGPYACTGNLSISVPAASGVLANDFLGLNPGGTITAFDATSAHGGTVSLTTSGVNAGAFTYQPAAGFDGTDTFTYTLTNTTGSSIGTVSITVSNMVWFINNAAGSAGDGRFASPFKTLAAFQAINDGGTNHGKSGDAIFIYQGSGNYTGPLTLLSNQRLTGQGDALTPTTLGFTPAADTNVTLPSATAKPTLSGTLTLATGVTALAIDLNTGTSTGITGSGGLTGVTVGDSSPTATNGFTVTTTTGTAVTLNNVGGTFTFRSINANGTGGSNTTGVSLVTMTGSFTVTGDGSTANSGGTIQHETGVDQNPVGTGSQGIGFYMNNAQNVSLSFMHLHDFDNFGLQGITVSNLTLAHCTFDGSNGNQTTFTGTVIATGDPNQGEGSVYLYNLTGTCSFSNCTFSGGISDTVEIVERTGTLGGLTIDTCSFSETNTTNGGDGLDIFGPGSTNANIAVSVTNSTFTQAHGTTLSYISNGSGTMSATVTGNTFTNNDPMPAGLGVSLTYAGSNTGATGFSFDVENNTFGGTATDSFRFAALEVGKAVPSSAAVVNASGKIINNTFGTSGVQGSSTRAGSNADALEVDCDGQGTMTTLIKDNHIHGFDENGMSVFVEEGSVAFNGTIIGNTIDTPNAADSISGMTLLVGAATGDTNLACLHVGSVLSGETSADKNSISGAPGTGGLGAPADIVIEEQASGAQLNFPNYTGGQTSQANLTTYLEGGNSLADSAVVFNSTSNNFHNTPGGADCAQPPLLFAPGGVEPDATARIHGRSGSSLTQNISIPRSAVLDQASLNFMVRAAIQRWKDAGLSDDQLANLRGLRFGVGDLTDNYLGASNPDLVIFDRKAAGHGWFIDRSPLNDKEFVRRVSSTLLYASPEGAPAGRLDLLTAVAHEMGHRLGLPDSYGSDHRGELMYGTLSAGERRLPSKAEAENTASSQDGSIGSGPEKKYVLRAVQGENTNEETKRYAEKLDPGILNDMAQAAVQRWQDAGVSPAELDRLQNIQLQVVDLPGDELSVTTRTSIQIDETAAGYGWFADRTPQTESNFTLPIRGQEFQADLDSPAFGRMDLLTVMMNAYGRILNKKEKHAPNVMQEWLMKSWLSAGTRRIPAPGLPSFNNQTGPDQTGTETSPKGGKSGRKSKGRFTPQSGPVDVFVGTLPAGKSVIVKFQVTVNNPLTSPSTATTVSNTGSVSGTNFTTISSNTDTAQLCVPITTTTALSNQQVAQGTTATFTTTLTGATPFTYVWKKNGLTITSGVSLGGRATISTSTTGSSTTSTLTITGTIPSDSDTYTVDGTDLAACGDAAVHQSATLTVVSPPTVTKSFSPTTIPVGGISTITLTLTNPNTTVTLTGVNFSDNFAPGSGLQVANPAGIGSTCSGTWNATPGDTFLNFGGGTLPPGSSCSLTVKVTSTKSGTINNATNAPQSTEGGFGVASNTATLTVIGPPTISKAFVLNRTIAASPTGATESGSTVTITTTTPHGFLVGQSVVIAGVGAGGYNGTFTIATVPTATSFTYTDGSTGLGASGGGTATVGENTMPLNGVVTLKFTLNNPNASPLSGIAFSDTLPAGLQVAATPNASDSCGGTFAPSAGDTTLTFTSGMLASSGTCLVTVDVTATTAGVKNNTTGAVMSTEGGTGTTASASITVLSPPSISKAFGAANISPGGTATLTFTVTNPNASNSLVGVAFTDALPSGLQVAATPGASTSCGGTFAPNAGDTTLNFSGGTIAGGGTCTISVNITGTTGGVKNNTTGNVTSANAGTGNTASASITVASPPSISKAFSPTTIPLGGTSHLTFTITNPNASISLTGVGFTDALPSGVQVAATPNASASCGGTFAPNAGDTTLTFSGGTLSASGSCTVAVDVTGTTAGVKNNTSGAVTSNEGGSGNTASATLTVIAPPTISKAFVLNSTIASSPTGATESGSTVTITTTTPHGFLVGQTVVIAGVGVAGYNGSFTIASTPTPTTFTYTDSNTGLAASGGGTASVGESTMPVNGVVTLMFTLTNPNPTPLTSVAFTDSLPTGMHVAATPNASAPCGAFTPAAGDGSLSFSGGTLAGNATCVVSVDVTEADLGLATNVSGAISSTEGGTGVQARASITVLAPPSISKAFGAANISPGGTTTLTFTITNPNPSNQLLGVAFTDALPAGLQVAATPGASTSCGGTFAPNAGDTTLNFSGGTITAAGTCTIVVNVTGTTGGVKNNTTGNVTSANAGTGNTASATLSVAAPPTVSKAFNPTTIPVGGVSQLTLTLTNPNAGITLTGVDFSDNFPAGLQVANPAGIGSTCSGTWNATPGDTTLNFGGGTLAPGSSCTLTVNVTGTTAGVKNNTTNAPESTESGTGVPSNTATLTVTGPPTISKEFELLSQIAASPTGATESGTTVTITTTAPHFFVAGESVSIAGVGVAGYNGAFTIASVPSATTFTYTDATSGLAASGGGTAIVVATQMPLGGTASLLFTITNPNATTSLTGVSFTDALPSGLQVAATPNASAPCGTFSPNPGDTTLSFTGGTLATSATCIISVDVTATSAGVKNNTTGAITSNEGGTGNTASASVTVVTPPSISKAFGSPNIPLNGTTTLTFTITNPNTTAQLTGVGFTDPLPSGLQVASTPGASASCGGTFSPNAGDTTLTFSGGTISASGTCTVAVNVTGTTVGVKNNTSGAVTSNEGGTGNTASDTLSVAAAPTISKAFGASSILVGQTTSLQFTITNPNSTLGLTGVSFTDTLPAGLTVPNGTSTTCGGGTVTTTAPGTITLTGGTLAASGNCSFSVTVTGASAGVWNNTTGAVSSNESGAGTTSNTATLTVIAAPTISKSFDASTIPLNGTSVLTFTITNPNTTTTLTGVAFTDTLPSGLTVPNGTSTTCGGGTLTTTAPGTIGLTGGSIAPSSNCVITVTVTGSTSGVKNNTTGAVSSTNGGTGTTSNTATITVLAPPTISKAFGAPNIALNGTTTLTFTLTNPNATVALTGAAFTDALPSGLQVAATPGASTSCGGTFAPNAGDTTLSFSGGTISAGGTCTVSVNVTGTTGGVKNNTTGAISSTNGGTGTTSNTATLTVATAPTISKAFGVPTVPVGGTTSLTFTVTNTNATLGITGVSFTDTLPAGLTVPNGTSSTCGGGTVTITGNNTITLTGGSIAAAGNCSFSVTVTGATAGVKNNTTGAISSNESGAGATSNTATLTVVAAPSIAKAFSAPTVPLGGTATVTFTITNPNATVALTGVGFADSLPAGLKVAATPNASSTIGGTITATAGSSSITFSGGTVPAAGSGTVSVNVTGMAAGVNNNTTGAVTSANGGTGAASNTATITVVAPPTIAKAFGKSVVPPGQTTTLTFTLTNPNPTVALTGVAFTDAFPAGLIVANPANASTGCGGTFAPNPGDTTLTFSGGTIPAGGSCTITVTVEVTTATTKVNVTSAVTSANGGTGNPSNPATVSSLDKCLRDDATGNFVQFSSVTGDYLFTICGPSGFTMSGTGTLRVIGAQISITDSKPDRTVNISYSNSALTGTATLTKVVGPGLTQRYSIRDTNPHPVCQCGS